MKMVKKISLAIVLSIVLCSSVMSLEAHNRKNRGSGSPLQYQRPNIADLNNQMKVIKPYMTHPFFPQEVDRISAPKRKTFGDDRMQNAILLGPQERSGGLAEKPSMYSTVIEKHKTTVLHPVPKPVAYAVHPDTARAFDTDQSEMQNEITRLNPGAYSIPVKIQGGSINDPTLSGYETPSFISKGEKKIQQPPVPGPINLQAAVQKDIETFVAQFDNAKDKAERTNVLQEGKIRLAAESQKLAQEVEAELKDLLFAKEVAIKMNNLMANYDMKMRKDQLSKLKLADEVTIKNILRDKLHRELQGFRTGKGEFRELEIVNPEDIKRIIGEIKMKLGQ